MKYAKFLKKTVYLNFCFIWSALEYLNLRWEIIKNSLKRAAHFETNNNKKKNKTQFLSLINIQK